MCWGPDVLRTHRVEWNRHAGHGCSGLAASEGLTTSHPAPSLLSTSLPATDGQTGSGKTFTIYGNEKLPGLTPRGVTELYAVMDRDSGKASFRISCFMLELYCDDLTDLLAEHKKGDKLVGGAAGWLWCWLRGCVLRGGEGVRACGWLRGRDWRRGHVGMAWLRHGAACAW